MFVIAQGWTQSKYPPTKGCLNKFWYIYNNYGMLCSHAAIKKLFMHRYEIVFWGGG